MLGWKLFIHSLRMVFLNGASAAKVGLPLIGCYVVAFVIVGQDIVSGIDPKSLTENSGVFLIALLLIIIGSLWTVVAWHRFVLLEEYPAMLPQFHGAEIMSYVGSSLLIGLVAGVVIFLGGFLGFFLVGTAPGPLVVVSFVSMTIAIWIFYRLSPVLPAAALGQSIRLAEAWAATKPMSMAALIAAALSFALNTVLVYVAETLGQIIPPLGLAAGLASNVVITLVGSSLLTTIYGVAIEKRTL